MMMDDSQLQAIPDLSRPALEVAPELLNCNLCIRAQVSSVRRVAITEVEAYQGFDDKASHAHRGPTTRNQVMFGPPGYWYIYLCYGVHWLLNLVTAESEYPSAALIRGIEGFDGPGKLIRVMGIDKRFNEQVCAEPTGLWIEPLSSDHPLRKVPIVTSGRVGVAYAGPHWSKVPWRFYREGHAKG